MKFKNKKKKSNLDGLHEYQEKKGEYYADTEIEKGKRNISDLEESGYLR